jgi:ABC-type amino acid transport system permease subunit
VQLVALYFGSVAYGLAVPPLGVAVGVFALHYAAFFVEKFRSSYLTVGRQQTEAAYALGLPRRTAATRIVVPQLALLTYPASVNAFLGMVKDSAVLSVIALTDAIQSAKNVGALTFDYVPAFTFAAAIFVLFYLVAQAGGRRLEAWLIRRYGGLGAG